MKILNANSIRHTWWLFPWLSVAIFPPLVFEYVGVERMGSSRAIIWVNHRLDYSATRIYEPNKQSVNFTLKSIAFAHRPIPSVSVFNSIIFPKFCESPRYLIVNLNNRCRLSSFISARKIGLSLEIMSLLSISHNCCDSVNFRLIHFFQNSVIVLAHFIFTFLQQIFPQINMAITIIFLMILADNQQMHL